MLGRKLDYVKYNPALKWYLKKYAIDALQMMALPWPSSNATVLNLGSFILLLMTLAANGDFHLCYRFQFLQCQPCKDDAMGVVSVLKSNCELIPTFPGIIMES